MVFSFVFISVYSSAAVNEAARQAVTPPTDRRRDILTVRLLLLIHLLFSDLHFSPLHILEDVISLYLCVTQTK